MQKTAGVKSVTQPLVNSNGTAAVYTLISDYAPSSRKTEDLVNDLRDNVIPKATKGQGMTRRRRRHDGRLHRPGQADQQQAPAGDRPSCWRCRSCCCSLAFRSLLVPLKAVVMNLLSIARRVRRRHLRVRPPLVGARSSGSTATVPIVSFVPLMMFAILFGLSMDYEVFLMTHVRERCQATDDPHEAVVDGLAGTGARHHLGGADHGQRVLRLHPQRRPEHQAVRARDGRRGRGRRHDRALPAGAGDHVAARPRRAGGCRAGWTAPCRSSASRARSTSPSATPPRRRQRSVSRNGARRPRSTAVRRERERAPVGALSAVGLRRGQLAVGAGVGGGGAVVVDV